MAEQKTKSTAPKKLVATKAGNMAAKPKAAKAAVTTAAKKAVAKKTAAPVAAPKKTKAPAVKKVTVPPIKKEAPVKKVATARKGAAAAGKVAIKPTPEERYRMVQTAAYFIAERNGFQGCSTSHWIAAENEIAAKLR